MIISIGRTKALISRVLPWAEFVLLAGIVLVAIFVCVDLFGVEVIR